MKRIQDFYIFDTEINAEKMIFLSGPRQVGKTTFVKNKLKELQTEYLYFNWDDPYVRKEYTTNPHFLKSYLARTKNKFSLVSFDEIHKHKNWKNILKGLYDLHHEEAQFIVTGSAMLDYFRKSGDSLVGRYFSYKLFPMGVAEAAQNFDYIINDSAFLTEPSGKKILNILQDIDSRSFKNALEQLLLYGGFPEPFLKSSERFSIKWRRDYQFLIVREDLRDLTRIQDIKGLEQLVLLLPERIGSPLSINSLKNDVLVNHKTVSLWLESLKKVYLIFSIMPWSKRLSRAIKKEPKYYFFDWTMVRDEGARFENLIAVSLLCLISRWNELGIGNFELRYIRNQEGKEVDFVIIKNQIPIALFEAKKGGTDISKAGVYFNKLLNIPYYQLISETDIVEEYPNNIYLISAWRILGLLG